LGALKFRIVHVGKPHRPYVLAGIEHFRRKIRPYASLSLTEVKEEPLRKGITPERVRSLEGDRIRKQMESGQTWIAMDPGGRGFESEAFAAWVQSGMNRGRSRLSFLIGGPHGLAPEVVAGADLALSLSRMTLSHEPSMLALLEQTYRCLAILNRLPYPK